MNAPAGHASIALVGASDRPASLGATVWRNLHGNGFKGRCFAVNPRHSSFDGVPAMSTTSPTVMGKFQFTVSTCGT